MAKSIRKIPVFLLVLGILLFGNHPVWAQDASIRMVVSSTNVEVGDRVTVQLTVESNYNIGSIQGTLKYDNTRLRYQSDNSNALLFEDGKGTWNDFFQTGVKNAVYTLEFEAVSTGQAYVSVEQSEIIGEESGKILGTPIYRVEVTINENEPVVDPEPEKPQDVGFVGRDGKGEEIIIYYTVPEHMFKEGWNIETNSTFDQPVEYLISLDEGWRIYSGLDSSFKERYYLYDKTKETFVRFEPIGVQTELVLIPRAVPPVGYKSETLKLQGILVDGFVSENGDILLHGIGKQEQEGFYRYDPQEDTIQRVFVKEVIRYSDSIDSNQNIREENRKVIMLWIALLVVLTLILFFSLLYYRKKIETLTMSKK